MKLITYDTTKFMEDYYSYVADIISQINLTNPCYLNHNHNLHNKEHLIEAYRNNFKQIYVNVEDAPISNGLVESSICIIEYSKGNTTKHEKKLQYYKTHLNKFVYMPFVPNIEVSTEPRVNTYDVVTSFYNITHIRRQSIVDNLINDSTINYINTPKLWGESIYSNFYSKTKILLNVHANQENRVLEEIRVLPAILSKAIVISEKSCYSELLPYKDYIIWVDYENIYSTIKDVLTNYSHYYNKFFSNTNVQEILYNLKRESISSLKTLL